MWGLVRREGSGETLSCSACGVWPDHPFGQPDIGEGRPHALIPFAIAACLACRSSDTTHAVAQPVLFWLRSWTLPRCCYAKVSWSRRCWQLTPTDDDWQGSW